MADPCEGAANWGNESSGSRANHSPYGKSKPKRRRRWKGGEEIERSSHACLSSLWIVEHGHGHDHVEKNVKPVQFAAKNVFFLLLISHLTTVPSRSQIWLELFSEVED